MSEILQKWIEAALRVADSENMSDDEVIPTWPDFCVERFPDFYPQLTVGALREWQSSRSEQEEGQEGLLQAIDCLDPRNPMFGINYNDEMAIYTCAYCEFAIEEYDSAEALRRISHDSCCAVTRLREALPQPPQSQGGQK